VGVGVGQRDPSCRRVRTGRKPRMRRACSGVTHGARRHLGSPRPWSRARLHFDRPDPRTWWRRSTVKQASYGRTPPCARCYGHVLALLLSRLPLTSRASARTLFTEDSVSIRIFNSRCSSMARPFYLATALRPVVRVTRSTTQGWINRHSGAPDSNKEGEAP
jgi:hypothetical protein